jgi:hypothetical protein
MNMPKGNVPKQTRQKAILALMNKGITSPTEIVRKLDEEYGIITTRQTVHRDISEGVEPVTEEILDEHKASMIQNLDSLAEVAYTNGVRGDSKAMDTYTKLVKTKTEVLKQIVQIQDLLKKTERPIYQIRIGNFDKAKIEGDKNGKSDK